MVPIFSPNCEELVLMTAQCSVSWICCNPLGSAVVVGHLRCFSDPSGARVRSLVSRGVHDYGPSQPALQIQQL